MPTRDGTGLEIIGSPRSLSDKSFEDDACFVPTFYDAGRRESPRSSCAHKSRAKQPVVASPFVSLTLKLIRESVAIRRESIFRRRGRLFRRRGRLFLFRDINRGKNCRGMRRQRALTPSLTRQTRRTFFSSSFSPRWKLGPEETGLYLEGRERGSRGETQTSSTDLSMNRIEKRNFKSDGS